MEDFPSPVSILHFNNYLLTIIKKIIEFFLIYRDQCFYLEEKIQNILGMKSLLFYLNKSLLSFIQSLHLIICQFFIFPKN